ncbi:RNA exonuclease 3 [Lithohypha guttulata]|uniref:RNA exonuclease 3 n=1 Tax=Lithohypha guttulata TaxID=1690604 RepID=A0AAN7T266_9EURO|nr:RNA exonuclease 3 [Lithohypha guttulata]
MFSSRGLFKDIPCPGEHNCTLPNCLFNHAQPPEFESASVQGQAYDPEAIVPAISPPPAKRRRLESPTSLDGNELQARQPRLSDSSAAKAAPNSVHQHEPSSQLQPSKRRLDAEVNGIAEPANKKRLVSPSISSQNSRQNTTTNPTTKRPVSITRAVSPPLVGRLQKTSLQPSSTKPTKPKLKVLEIKDEPLNPRKIERNPVQYTDRQKKLAAFYAQLEKRQQTLREELQQDTSLLLSAKELKKIALDEEERIANAAANVASYNNQLRDRLVYHIKMAVDVYKSCVPEFRVTGIFQSPQATSAQDPPTVDTGLDSTHKQVAVLKHLRTGLHQHAKHGYVIKLPEDKDIGKALAAEKTMRGWEICDRCSRRFQVFRGRNAEGELAGQGNCNYHWGRLMPASSSGARQYSCCKNPSDSDPCTTAQHHVFKVSDPARLAALLQFKQTPSHNDGKHRPPVVFDCEMCYTTCGFELIRLTALQWPGKKVLLDFLVRTIGEVIDLNTRFSGVSEKMYSTAPSYPQHSRNLFPSSGELLQKVASPAAAREYLFDLLDPETPLIGHAIENDLNACRVIHPFVIDTVLLFPHRRPLPVRKALRDLAREHLGRIIQAGGAEGHDSKEDSEATGDLVLVKVKEKWTEYQMQGWYWRDEDDALMPPQAKSKNAASSTPSKSSNL